MFKLSIDNFQYTSDPGMYRTSSSFLINSGVINNWNQALMYTDI